MSREILSECYEWLFGRLTDGPRVSDGAIEKGYYTPAFRDFHDRLQAAISALAAQGGEGQMIDTPNADAPDLADCCDYEAASLENRGFKYRAKHMRDAAAELRKPPVPVERGDLTDCRVPHSKYEACHNCDHEPQPATHVDFDSWWDANQAFDPMHKMIVKNAARAAWNAATEGARVTDRLLEAAEGVLHFLDGQKSNYDDGPLGKELRMYAGDLRHQLAALKRAEKGERNG